jgi:predicted nuclease with RNAse H fold
MTELTLGVDLAAADARTALCQLDWGSGGPVLEHLSVGASDDEIVRLAAQSAVVAIDAPFGWPRTFARTVAAYAAGAPWPAAKPSGLWARRTDEAARARVGGRPPLSVSSDRIARPAERAARLLTLLGREIPLARDGSDGVIELYPAGAMRLWGIDTAGYKRPAARMVREALRDRIVTAVHLKLSADQRERLVETDHALDALVAALVGRAFSCGWAAGPETPEDREAAEVEGWIWLPTCTLEALSMSCPRA